MKRKDLIFISIIIILLISLVLTIIHFKKNNYKTIVGEVLVVGSNYLLIGTSNNEDYVINTDAKDYQIGDKLKLLITNVKLDKTPYEASVKDITIVSSYSDKNNFQDNLNNDTNNEIISDNDNNYQNNVEENNDSNNHDNIVNNTNDDSIVIYFENLNNKLVTYNNDENIENTIKSGFINCIDFIFYNKEINGKTFNELTNATKLKILYLTLSIDSKIDEKFPGYKDTISSTYQNIKSKIIEKYLETTTNICNNDSNLCITAKEGFADLKTNFGITWDVIKGLANNGVSKLRDWYEIWRYQ